MLFRRKYTLREEEGHEALLERIEKRLKKRRIVLKRPKLTEGLDEIEDMLRSDAALWDVTPYCWDLARNGVDIYVVILSAKRKRPQLIEATRAFLPSHWRTNVAYKKALWASIVLKSLSGELKDEWFDWLRAYYEYYGKRPGLRTWDDYLALKGLAIKALWAYGKVDPDISMVAKELGLKKRRGGRWYLPKDAEARGIGE